MKTKSIAKILTPVALLLAAAALLLATSAARIQGRSLSAVENVPPSP